MKFGKLPTLPWYLRLVVFLVVAGVMYAGFWYFMTRGTRTETKTMQDEIAQLKPRNAQAQIASQRLNEFRAIYKAREEEYAELKHCFLSSANSQWSYRESGSRSQQWFGPGSFQS